MSEPYLATLRGEVREFETLFKHACVLHSRASNSPPLYCVIRESQIEAYAHHPPQIKSFCTFNQAYLSGGISLPDDTRIDVGFHPQGILEYLNNFGKDDFVELRFTDREQDSPTGLVHARRVQVREQITNPFFCFPIGEEDISLRDELQIQFSEEDIFLIESGNKLAPIQIQIPTEELKRYMSLVEDNIKQRDANESYNSLVPACPFVFRDGRLQISLAKTNSRKLSESMWGELKTYSADGPDTTNHYHTNLGKVLRLLKNGTIALYTDPDDADLGIVHNDDMGAVYRYVVSSIDVSAENSLFVEPEITEEID